MANGTLLAVFAHPDDEAFGTGGTLAKYASEGFDVHLITATRGEAGEISAAVQATAASLPDVREQELRCACRAYGIHPPRFLGYMDGQLAIVHQGQAVGKFVRLIREIRPDVLLTFGPDGIYGHYDHIAVHRWATIAVSLAADVACFPDYRGMEAHPCVPHAVSKVYWRILSVEQVAAMRGDSGPAAVMMDGVPFPLVGYPASEITTIIDVGSHVDTKIAGIRCHASQLPEERADAYAEAREDPGLRIETFRLASSTVGWPQGIEADLFERIGTAD